VHDGQGLRLIGVGDGLAIPCQMFATVTISPALAW
jgi:hypothetical protein